MRVFNPSYAIPSIFLTSILPVFTILNKNNVPHERYFQFTFKSFRFVKINKSSIFLSHTDDFVLKETHILSSNMTCLC